MGKDELTRMQELAKRITLLEKMALRQQSRLDELMKRVEQAERGTTRLSKRPIEKAELPPYEEPLSSDVESTVEQQGSPSISDFMDEDMKEDLARAYGSQLPPEKKKKQQEKKASEPTASEMERAVDSYEKAKGDKESIQSDREKQNEAVRQKTAEAATLDQIPTVELREKTPAERAADYIRDYNALYDVKGTMFQKKKAQDDFIRQYEVQGMKCTNMQLRFSRPELEPRFVAVAATRDADFWGMPFGNNLFAVVPNPFLIYNEEMHTAGGMREAFYSNYRTDHTYTRFIVKEIATFQFGTIGKVFKKGQIEVKE